ncbi:hypothetical protein D910_00421 [Dendroctonus ponderosae]
MSINNQKAITNHIKDCEDASIRSVSSEDVSQAVPRGYCCAKSINPADGRGRKLHLLQMLVLPFIPILALIVQTSVILRNIMILKNDSIEVENQVTAATELGKVVTRMQLERSEVAFYLYTGGKELNRTERTDLKARFKLTNEALGNMSFWPPLNLQIDGSRKVYLDKETFLTNLTTFRQTVNQSEETTFTDVLAWYTSVNAAMLEHLTQQIKETDTSGVWRYLLAFKNLLKSIESTGIASVYGVNYFGKGILKKQNYISYIQHDSIAKDLLNTSLNYVAKLKQEYNNLSQTMIDYGNIKKQNDIIIRNIQREPNYTEALNYFDSIALYTDELRKLQRSLRVTIGEYVSGNLRDAANQEAVGITILIVVLAVSPVIIWLVHNAVATIQLYAANLSKKANELKREKKKSDLLLFQMLPPSVATQLKQTRQVPAEYYASVTVYFSDIVGFTEIAAISTPLEVKIPNLPSGNKHVSEIASMALDLLAGSRHFKIPHRKSEKLQIRSGAHTGPVVAGIVGSKMPRYCLFGDTVNTASRMESTGVASKIHISLEMKKALDAIGGYKIEERGLVEVKGKGLMETFWLTCKEGVTQNTVEIEAPSYFPEDEDMEPVFIKRLKDKNYF